MECGAGSKNQFAATRGTGPRPVPQTCPDLLPDRRLRAPQFNERRLTAANGARCMHFLLARQLMGLHEHPDRLKVTARTGSEMLSRPPQQMFTSILALRTKP